MENRLTNKTPGDGAHVSLRPALPEDEPLLFTLYAGSRADEMAAWGWDAAQQEAFLRMQFNAQRMSYGAQYVDADHRIIISGEQPVGRILVERSGQRFLLVDIAVLAEHRNAGIGTALIRDLQREATQAGLPVELHVLKTNGAAARLYERLGFAATDDDGIYLQMRWWPRA